MSATGIMFLLRDISSFYIAILCNPNLFFGLIRMFLSSFFCAKDTTKVYNDDYAMFFSPIYGL